MSRLTSDEILQTFKNRNKHRKRLSKYLKKLQTFHTSLSFDISNLTERLQNCLKVSSYWGKVLAFTLKIQKQLELDLDTYDAYLRIRFIEKYSYKDAVVRAKIKIDKIHYQLAKEVGLWTYYNTKIEHMAFWPSARVQEVINKLLTILQKS